MNDIFGKGLEENTIHYLQNRHSGESKEFEWTGKSWSTPKTEWGTKPAFMSALGWKYLHAKGE